MLVFLAAWKLILTSRPFSWGAFALGVFRKYPPPLPPGGGEAVFTFLTKILMKKGIREIHFSSFFRGETILAFFPPLFPPFAIAFSSKGK